MSVKIYPYAVVLKRWPFDLSIYKITSRNGKQLFCRGMNRKQQIISVIWYDYFSPFSNCLIKLRESHLRYGLARA